MALVHADRVKESSTTTGTGTYSLGGAADSSWQTFLAAIGNGNTCHYAAFEAGAGWEVGIGTVASGTPATLARTSVLKSSNANAAVNWSAGLRTLIVTPIADKYLSTIDLLTTRGDILVRGASLPQRLALGTAGAVLGSDGTDAAWIAHREKLTANRTYYVRTDGSDSNTGLANSSGGAFLTIQKAVNTAFGSLDLGGFNVTIQVGAGTYTGGVLQSSPQVGAGDITILGDTTTPSNVFINTTGVGAVVTSSPGVRLLISGLKVASASSADCVAASFGSYIRTVTKMEYGAVASGHHVGANSGGMVDTSNTAEIISGSVAGSHYVTGAGYIYVQGASWTATGSPSVGQGFAQASQGGVIYAFANSKSGTLTGAYYNANLNGIVQTNGGGATYFMGNSAGSTASGGQYA